MEAVSERGTWCASPRLALSLGWPSRARLRRPRELERCIGMSTNIGEWGVDDGQFAFTQVTLYLRNRLATQCG